MASIDEECEKNVVQASMGWIVLEATVLHERLNM